MLYAVWAQIDTFAKPAALYRASLNALYPF
jgi:hypothetical protein